MVETKTTWVLNLMDKVTAPLKSMVQNVQKTTSSVGGLNDRYKFTKKEIKEAITNSVKHHKELQTELRQNARQQSL